jgi:hypothetical protein
MEDPRDDAAPRSDAGGVPSGPATLPPQRGSFLHRHGLKLLLSILLGTGIAWLVARGGLPLIPPTAAFARMRWWTVPAYAASLVVVHWFRAARWRFLLRPLGEVPLRSVISVSWLAFAIIMLSPLRSGEIARPVLIARRGTVRGWEATGTIGAERVIDGLALSLILFAALQIAPALSPLPDHVGDLALPVSTVPRAAYGVLALFSAAFVTMGVFFYWRAWARHATFVVIGLFSRRLAGWMAGVVERIADGLRFLPSPKLMAPFLLETALYWGANALGVWLLAWGSGLEGITLAEACVVMGCIGIGILVPAGPGYFGAFQLSTFMALAMFFPEDALKGCASAFVFLLYACQIGWHIVAAGLALALDPETKLSGAGMSDGNDRVAPAGAAVEPR